MTKKHRLILLGVNLICIICVLFSYFRPAKYLTRVSFYTLKTYQKPQTSFKSESPNDILSDLLRLRKKIDYQVRCDMSVQESVEVGTVFFDILCEDQGNAKAMFRELFWLYLSEELVGLGKTIRTIDQLKDFYYLNQLTEININSSVQIILPRSSFIFEDHSSRIPIKDFIVYLFLSLITLNLFLYKFFISEKRRR